MVCSTFAALLAHVLARSLASFSLSLPSFELVLLAVLLLLLLAHLVKHFGLFASGSFDSLDTAWAKASLVLVEHDAVEVLLIEVVTLFLNALLQILDLLDVLTLLIVLRLLLEVLDSLVELLSRKSLLLLFECLDLH